MNINLFKAFRTSSIEAFCVLEVKTPIIIRTGELLSNILFEKEKNPIN